MLNIKAFEEFVLDGRVNNSDFYLSREAEDFSRTGAFNVAEINRYAQNRGKVFEYGLIA
ncbi:MAG: hypothetical protein IJT79_00015 [Ruminococcus sp.]|nr:hypothetical protein [Ruminococcus sp.]